ncbi:S-adenosylmethionine carrier 1, chloroplastic/mitochondrial isoform X1 [Arachis hypogaea]|uniref:S-adenosylmethionine carrier 1, chloroplastic/mitochondrial isoform X1 n=1 Tax=Arachis hypogaea TaxID=3818 RepID=UPI003B2203D7
MSYMAAARRNLNDPENAIIGAFAGALTGAITTPLDVIKTRLMVQMIPCYGSANQYNGIVDCVQTIIKEEGPSALLKVLLFQHMNDLVLENICDRVRKAGMMKKKQQQKEQVK